MKLDSVTAKRLKETYKRKQVVLHLIERHVMKKANEPDLERRSDILHPSEMCKADWCPRHDFYRIIGIEVTGSVNAGFRLENIFDYGHSIHAKYQRWLQEMGILWGTWECKDCKHRWIGNTPATCPSCASDLIKYKEIPLASAEYMIEGHADGGLLIEDSVPLLLEIKSIGMGTIRIDAPVLWKEFEEKDLTIEQVFWRITRPFPSHIRQGMLYLFLARALTGIEFSTIVFIYEFKATQETKEFVLTYNEAIVRPLLEKAKTVVDAVDTGVPPERPEWAEIEGKVCKACEYKHECWGTTPRGSKKSEAPAERPVVVRRATAAKRRRAIRPSA